MRHKKEVYKRWKQGLVILEEYADNVCVCAGMALGRPKSLELNLVRNINGSQEVFLHTYQQKKNRENVGLLSSGTGNKGHGEGRSTQYFLFLCLYL